MPDVIINGQAGRLEARFSRGPHARSPVGLVLHPHPQFGGTMNNKVVFTLHQALRRHGFATLRFNFRGVGHSQGRYGGGEGELADAAAALDWLREHLPNATQRWVAGFSFGAWIGMQLLMRRPGIDRFISVAPPANLFDFGFLAPCPSSGLIVQGERDDLVPEPVVAQLVRKLSLQKDIRVDYQRIEGACHFFTDHIETLTRRVDDYLVHAPTQPVVAT